MHGRLTWFLRKAAASLLEHRLVCKFVRSGVAFGFATPRTAADTVSLATRYLFGKLFCVAITFGFGEKRCRKNLPFCGLNFW